jgi:tetratricopeptide (TPR) repeat protein
VAYTSEIEKLERRWLENPKGRNFAPLADAYRKAGELDRAIDLCKSGLERHPDYVSAHIVYGRCLLDMKNDAGASDVFAKVLALDPENIIALKILGEVAERNSRFDEAVNWLTRLLAADPMNGDAAEALARAKSKAGSAKIAEAPTAAMAQPDFVVEHTSASDATPVVAQAQPSPGLVEVFDGTLDANAAAHAAAKADGLEVQEDVELSSQQVEQVEVEGLARTQYEGSGLFRLDTSEAAAPQAPVAPMPELIEESLSPVDLPLIMPDDLPARSSRPSASVPEPPQPPRPRASIPAAVALSDDDGAADTAALSRAEPVLTETMAELYLKQGHQHDALRVYQALLAQRPGDAGLQRKVDQLSGGGHRRRGAAGGTGGSGVSAQSFLRGVFAGRGAAAMPPPDPAPAPPPPSSSAPTTLEAAFETAPETEESLGPAPGHPTHPADDHISLDSVFGEDASRRSGPGGEVAGPQDAAGGGEGGGAGDVKGSPAGGGAAGAGGGFSFDQFFGGGAGGTPASAAAAEPRQPARASGRTQRPPENEGELDQFQQWLKKLKS